MRGGILAAGIALLVVGIVLWVIGAVIAADATYMEETFLGVDVEAYDEPTYTIGVAMSWIGIILLIVGIIVATVGGAIKKPESVPQQSMQQPMIQQPMMQQPMQQTVQQPEIQPSEPVETPSNEVAVPIASEETSKKFCTSCGIPVSSDIKFCANCGEPLLAQGQTDEGQS